MNDGMEDIASEEDVQEMASDSDTPMAEEGQPETAAPIHIPAAALGRTVKAGETITLRVIEANENGVQAEVVASEGSGDYEEAGAAFDRMSAPAGY